VIEVKLYDDIDFMCPYYPPPTRTRASFISDSLSSSSSAAAAAAGGHGNRRPRHDRQEFYVVYMVSIVTVQEYEFTFFERTFQKVVKRSLVLNHSK